MEGGSDWVSLGDVCEINSQKYKRLPTSNGKTDAPPYRFHTGAPSTVLYTDTPVHQDEVIIINKTNGHGTCHITFDKECSVAQQAFALTAKSSQISLLEIYYVLMISKPEIATGYIGSAHKNLSLDFLKAFKIPLPKDPSFQAQLQPHFDELDALRQQVKTHEAEYKQALVELREAALEE